MKKEMTKEELAAKLDGKDYWDEITSDLISAANRNNLLLIHGNDRYEVVLDGSIKDEVYAYEGGIFHLNRQGVLESHCANDCPVFKRYVDQSVVAGEFIRIKAWWCGRFGSEDMDPIYYKKIGKPAWCFESEALRNKHAIFTVGERQDYADDVKYFSRGLVLDLDELFPLT